MLPPINLKHRAPQCKRNVIRTESDDVVVQFLNSRLAQEPPAPSPSPASSPGPVPSPAPSPSTGDSAPLWPMSVPEYIDFCDSVSHGVTDFSKGQTEVNLFVRGQRTPGSAGYPGAIEILDPLLLNVFQRGAVTSFMLPVPDFDRGPFLPPASSPRASPVARVNLVIILLLSLMAGPSVCC